MRIVTVFRANGLRFVIFVDDHEPAHVHVFGDGELKVNLLAPDGQVELIWAVNMKRSDIRRAIELVSEQQILLLQKWKDIHG